MPGSPPIRTKDPSTIPPPRMRSTSSLFRDTLASDDESMSDSLRGDLPAPGTEDDPELFLPVPGEGVIFCSVNVFHSPQAGQRPIHFGYSFPQLVQNQTVFSFILSFCTAINHHPMEARISRGWRFFLQRDRIAGPSGEHPGSPDSHMPQDS